MAFNVETVPAFAEVHHFIGGTTLRAPCLPVMHTLQRYALAYYQRGEVFDPHCYHLVVAKCYIDLAAEWRSLSPCGSCHMSNAGWPICAKEKYFLF